MSYHPHTVYECWVVCQQPGLNSITVINVQKPFVEWNWATISNVRSDTYVGPSGSSLSYYDLSGYTVTNEGIFRFSYEETTATVSIQAFSVSGTVAGFTFQSPGVQITDAMVRLKNFGIAVVDDTIAHCQ